jgi:hypothetical protein
MTPGPAALLYVLLALGSPARAPTLPDALTPDARQALQTIVARHDHGGAPFIVIDKRAARLWAFDGRARPRGSTPVLLGLARGDDTAPGIADKPLKKIRPHERTTPAGRFVAERGRNLAGEDILWVDYDAAVSMHRMRQVARGERRAERMASPGTDDNRISYGCINLPPSFYDGTLMRLIGTRRPIVYVLPETRPVESLFRAASAG